MTRYSKKYPKTSGVARMFEASGQRTLRAPAPPFSYLPFLIFSLSVGARFSSGAPGHRPPMPPTRYATAKNPCYMLLVWRKYH